MVKAGTDNITKGKKKKQAGDESGTFDALRHARIILDFLGQRFQRKFFKKIALVFLGIFLAIFALEIILRVTSHNYNLDPCQSLDDNFHHVMIPNTTCQSKTAEWDILYKINSLGLRDEEVGNKKTGEFRILLLGDSFVQGYGVNIENSFPKLLEKKLNENGHEKFKVINAGVIGYSPLIEYLYLAKMGLEFKPDMVILAFSLTDFWEDRKRFRELAASYPDLSEKELGEKIAEASVQFDFAEINTSSTQTSPVKIFAPQISYQIKQALRDNFKIYASFADFVKKRRLPIQPDVLYQGNIDKDIVALIRGEKISDLDWQKLWEVPINSLLMANTLLRNREIPFVVVAIGDAFQVSRDEWPGRSALGIPRDFGNARGDFQDELARRLKTLSIPFVNLLPKFRESDLFPLYYTRDGHWRNTGHELAAEIVFDYLQKSQVGQVK